MIRILFVCHGNICRSPMAEFVMNDLAKRAGMADRLEAASAATSVEEIGNGVHWGAREKLRAEGVRMAPHSARQMTRADYDRYDLLIGMDRMNVRSMLRILGGDPDGKVYRLLDFTDRPGDIADPWYTGDFDATYRDVAEGCEALIERLRAGRMA